MALLSREALLGATTLPTERVAVPELGGEILIRGLSGIERDRFEATLLDQRSSRRDLKRLVNARARLVVLCAVDDAGQRVFTDADADAIGLIRADVLDRLFDVAMRLSGMRAEDVDEAGKASA